jgi:hypothetical protein
MLMYLTPFHLGPQINRRLCFGLGKATSNAQAGVGFNCRTTPVFAHFIVV